MKNFLLLCFFLFPVCALLKAQEYKIITTIESIDGYGWSEIMDDAKDTIIYENNNPIEKYIFKKKEPEGYASTTFESTRLYNFHHRFQFFPQHIARNDALIAEKLNELASEGWTLAFVNSTESTGTHTNYEGRFLLTRYILKKE